MTWKNFETVENIGYNVLHLDPFCLCEHSFMRSLGCFEGSLSSFVWIEVYRWTKDYDK